MRQRGKMRVAMMAVFATVLLVPVSSRGSNTHERTTMRKNGTEKDMNSHKMTITVNGHTLTASLSDNSSADALRNMLSDGPATVSMHDYAGMEKVGSIGRSLPRNDENITTKAGDLILYQGNQFVIYYAPNTWNFTRLGRIDHVSAAELEEILGRGDVVVELSLAED